MISETDSRLIGAYFTPRFVAGDKPGRNTGFDIDDSDIFEMDQCRGVLVASAIFGIILYKLSPFFLN